MPLWVLITWYVLCFAPLHVDIDEPEQKEEATPNAKIP